ncbi:MAG: NAD(P)-dependent alcohol dehydrogenase [Gemmatimonadetes bacterium]|nr:NAD(P)-dependent alcohol dehydrogenase [Gemmatimonadota bacterium]
MKAVVYCDYGPPDVIRVADVEKPVPTDSQVLVRVRAASVNPLDWHYLRGTPYLARTVMGLRKPANVRLGVDFAGTVEAVGRSVTRFKPGDEVFGGRTGAFAEYLTIRETGSITLKPANVTFEQAAAVPVAGVTALQGLRDQGQVRAGQKVLVNGASGGVGTFAVQIAKALGAEVTGVSSTRNLDLIRSIGVDHAVDYTKENFTTGVERYDVILDNVANHPLSAFRRVLTAQGRYVMVGGPSGRWLDPMPRAAAASVVSWFVSQKLGFFVSSLTASDLAALAGMMAAGKVTPVIDRRYRLAEIREAVAYLETGRARGKVVIVME